ncbi:MAG: EAL domain-containing protein [Pseudomonadota bacterium]
MHPILKNQLREATQGDPDAPMLDIASLLELVDAYYARLDIDDTAQQPVLDAIAQLDLDTIGSDDATFAATTSSSGVRERFHGLDFSDLRAVLDNIGDMVMTVDEDGEIQFANQVAVRFFDPERRSLAGQFVQQFLLTPQSLGLAEALEPYLAELKAGDPNLEGKPLAGVRVDGTPLSLSLVASRLSAMAAGDYVLCLRDASVRSKEEALLRENEERYRALVEHAPEAILVFDIDANRFVDANEHASTLFNLSRGRLLSSAFFGLRNLNHEPRIGSEQHRIEQFLQRALAGEQPTFEWLYRDSHGVELNCEIRLSRMPASSQSLVRVSVVDIGPRKLQDQIDFSEKKLLEMIASGTAIEKVHRAICRVTESVVSGARATMMLKDSAGLELHLAAAPSFAGQDTRAIASLTLNEPSLSAGVAVATRQPVLIHDVLAHHAWLPAQQWARQAEIRAAWSFPLSSVDGEITGTLDLYLSEPREPTTEELDRLAGIARLAALAVGRERARQALSQSEGRFRSLFENVMEGVYIATSNGTLVAANPAMVKMLGYDTETELLQHARRHTTYYETADAERFEELIQSQSTVEEFESTMIRKDGERLTVIESARSVQYADGEVYIEGTIRDVTARRLAEQRIFKEKERAEVTLKSIADGVITTDATGCIDYMNPVAETMTGWSLRASVGQHVDDILTLVDEHTREMVDNPVVRCLNEGRSVTMSQPCLLVDKAGNDVSVQQTTAPIRDGGGHISGAVMVFHDAGADQRLSRRLSYQATHDALTGLVNRLEFENILERAIHRTRSNPNEHYALLYIDIDQFKVVNDTFGHTAGDELIRQLAARLESCVRPNDALSRLSGDEYGVLLAGYAPNDVMRVAEDIRASIECYRFEWQSAVHPVRASIGVVPLDGEMMSVTEVLGAADVACFAAKDMGRNQVSMYRDGAAGERHAQMHWLSRINRALEEDRFELYFQPIVHTNSDGQPDYCRHYELLLRMIDEEGGIVLPSTFIAAAERYDCMPSLDRWVVNEALNFADQGQPDEPAAYTLSINLSGNSLSDDRFLDFLRAKLQSSSLCAGAVCFEITETAAIANLTRVRRFMAEMKAMGCLFSLDDFGSGLCSFAYLKNLPVDFIKIDGTFVRQISADTFDQSVVGAIQQVAQAMGVETVAEYVESAEIRETLSSLGVSLMQGFEISEPVPMEQFSPWESDTAIKAALSA